MKITKAQNLSFKRALKESEIAGYTKTLNEARKVLGANGKNILIVPDTSLPVSSKSAIGNMSDKDALEFASKRIKENQGCKGGPHYEDYKEKRRGSRI